jgi:hypothetical protein
MAPVPRDFTQGLLSLGFRTEKHGFLCNPKPRDSNPWVRYFLNSNP